MVDVYFRIGKMEIALKAIKDLSTDPRISNLIDIALSDQVEVLQSVHRAVMLHKLSEQDIRKAIANMDKVIAEDPSIEPVLRLGKENGIAELKLRGQNEEL